MKNLDIEFLGPKLEGRGMKNYCHNPYSEKLDIYLSKEQYLEYSLQYAHETLDSQNFQNGHFEYKLQDQLGRY